MPFHLPRSASSGSIRAASRLIEKLPAVFCGTRSARPAKYTRKVLLRFKPACHGDIQDTDLRGAQHRLRTLYSLAYYELMRRLARRLAKHRREMGSAQPHRFRQLGEGQLIL